MKIRLLIAALAAIFMAACQKEAPPPTCPSPGCFTPLPCSEPFSRVFIHVYTTDGSSATLDSFVVTDASGAPLPPASNGSSVWGYLHPQNGILPGGCIIDSNGINGTYAICNDYWVPDHQYSRTPVWAKGYINGRAVFSEAYIIAADCCTASLYKGKAEIRIPR